MLRVKTIFCVLAAALPCTSNASDESIRSTSGLASPATSVEQVTSSTHAQSSGSGSGSGTGTGTGTNTNIATADVMQRFCNNELDVFDLSNKDKARLYSVCTAWFPGSPVPMISSSLMKSGEKWEDSCKILWQAPERERKFLSKALDITGADDTAIPLCYFAMLDSDKDGILDYQISDTGKFVENDIDVDGDNISNVRDIAPLNGEVGVALSCGNAPLPEHLNEACLNGNNAACNYQKKLFNEYDIVVLNRDFEASHEEIASNLKTVYDTATLVFHEAFENHPAKRTDSDCKGLWTMQTISFEQCATARSAPWDKNDTRCLLEARQTTEASAIAHNGQFNIYPAGSKLPPVIRLGTYVHEFGHLWQFAYDIRKPEDTVDIVKDNLWLVPEFETVLGTMGWKFPKVSAAEIEIMRARYTYTVPQSDELVEHINPEVTLNRKTLEYLSEAARWQGLVTSDENIKRGTFGNYSLSSAWEWHADLILAYLFRSLEEHIVRQTKTEEGIPDRAVSGEFISWFRVQVLQRYNNQFYHPNLKDTLYRRLKTTFPLQKESLDTLVCDYLINDDFVFAKLKYPSIHSHFQIQPPGHVRSEITERWRSTCGAS